MAASGGVPPAKPPAPPTGGPTPDDADRAIKQLTEFIHGQDSIDLTELTMRMRTEEKGRRITKFQDVLQKRLSEGVKFDDALDEAKGALTGAYDRPLTALTEKMAADWRAAGLVRIEAVLKDEPWELLSTVEAFDNALKGYGIPREVGVKGGSAYTRLSRVFPEPILDVMNARKPLSRKFEERMLKSPRWEGLKDFPVYPTPELKGEQMGLGLGGRPAQGTPIDMTAFRAWVQGLEAAKARGWREFQEWWAAHPLPEPGALSGETANAANRWVTIDGREVMVRGQQQPSLLPEPEIDMTAFRQWTAALDAAKAKGQKAFEEWWAAHPLPPLGPLSGETAASANRWDAEGRLIRGTQQPSLLPEEASTLQPGPRLSQREATMQRQALEGHLAGQRPEGAALPPRPPVPPTTGASQMGLTPQDEQRVRATLLKAGYTAVDIAGAIRALKSSIDISAPFRQGLMLAGQPKEFGGAFVDMLKSLRSEKVMAAIHNDIVQNPHYPLLVQSSIYQAPFGKGAIGNKAAISAREEAFATNIITTKGKWNPIAASQRAYITFLNSLRARTFYAYVDQYGEAGASTQAWRDLATFINRATGRGTLGPAEKYAPELATTFFSPRYFMSRLQAPLSLAADNPLQSGMSVSRIAAKNMVAFIGVNVALLSMVKMSGWGDVNLNPLSADFGKGKIGNTRFDAFAGYTQIARFVAMMMTGKNADSATGIVYPNSRLRTATNFGRSKLAPIPGAVADVTQGRTYSGDELQWDGKSILTVTGQLIAPMGPIDVYEAWREYGAAGLAVAPFSATGFGVNTYQAYSSQSALTQARKDAARRLFPGVEMNRLTAQQSRMVEASPQVMRARRLQEPKEPAQPRSPSATPSPQAVQPMSAAERRQQRLAREGQLAGAK